MPSFLAIEGLHVFITGAAGGIGTAAVETFLENGCNVTGFDIKPIEKRAENFFSVQGDMSDEESMASCIKAAGEHFGPIHILVANAGVTDESKSYPLWKMPLEVWEKRYHVNIRGVHEYPKDLDHMLTCRA
jgi:NAD(P)-dependent dehydrogenase (short-subunit alcohol dehydrogenase family)